MRKSMGLRNSLRDMFNMQRDEDGGFMITPDYLRLTVLLGVIVLLVYGFMLWAWINLYFFGLWSEPGFYAALNAYGIGQYMFALCVGVFFQRYGMDPNTEKAEQEVADLIFAEKERNKSVRGSGTTGGRSNGAAFDDVYGQPQRLPQQGGGKGGGKQGRVKGGGKR